MRPKGTKQKLEERRRLAVALYRRGWTIRQVAEEVGCAPGSVARWWSMYQAAGSSGLSAKPNAGGQPRLRDRERQRLKRLLLRGARRAGFRDDTWTLRRVAQLIEEEFGVRYHVGHVHRLIHDLGFSPQKPRLRARERDEEAVEQFRTRTWRRLKKKPDAQGARS